ncbi:hypothetical protein [Spiroplasma endosymbiont of Polydrusus cervinus]|uniref:hypothetical protein n=1 Tax=Spiroplasma endosymbiont of Polydrusus cervinus TaxID=3066287 RepID=UPI0030CB555E
MARKGQKFNKYTAYFRKMIVHEVKNNSISFIAKKYQINKKLLLHGMKILRKEF